MEIQRVKLDEANSIIEIREPLGLFYTIDSIDDKKVYVGIDNSHGDAWTEDFNTLQSCKRWLNGSRVRSAQGYIV